MEGRNSAAKSWKDCHSLGLPFPPPGPEPASTTVLPLAEVFVFLEFKPMDLEIGY